MRHDARGKCIGIPGFGMKKRLSSAQNTSCDPEPEGTVKALPIRQSLRRRSLQMVIRPEPRFRAAEPAGLLDVAEHSSFDRKLPPSTLPKYLWMSVFAWIL
jgi:hypothetical protein